MNAYTRLALAVFGETPPKPTIELDTTMVNQWVAAAEAELRRKRAARKRRTDPDERTLGMIID